MLRSLASRSFRVSSLRVRNVPFSCSFVSKRNSVNRSKRIEKVNKVEEEKFNKEENEGNDEEEQEPFDNGPIGRAVALGSGIGLAALILHEGKEKMASEGLIDLNFIANASFIPSLAITSGSAYMFNRMGIAAMGAPILVGYFSYLFCNLLSSASDGTIKKLLFTGAGCVCAGIGFGGMIAMGTVMLENPFILYCMGSTAATLAGCSSVAAVSEQQNYEKYAGPLGAGLSCLLGMGIIAGPSNFSPLAIGLSLAINGILAGLFYQRFVKSQQKLLQYSPPSEGDMRHFLIHTVFSDMATVVLSGYGVCGFIMGAASFIP